MDLAENGEEAVAMALKTPYHVIVMDCDMPLKDGWQVGPARCCSPRHRTPTRILNPREPSCLELHGIL